MAKDNVSPEALQELKSNLNGLSDTLHDIFELMNADMSALGEDWKDQKYEEFVVGYRPQIQKCEEISERYKRWCKEVLDPLIEETIDINNTPVILEGFNM